MRYRRTDHMDLVCKEIIIIIIVKLRFEYVPLEFSLKIYCTVLQLISSDQLFKILNQLGSIQSDLLQINLKF